MEKSPEPRTNKLRSSLSLRVSLFLFLLLLVEALIVGLLGLFFYRRDEVNAQANAAQMIAKSVAAAIDTDEYETLTETFEETPYWRELKALFDETKTSTDAMYLYALDNGTDGDIRFVVEGMKPADDPLSICPLGYQDAPGVFGDDAFLALSTGKSTVSGIYKSGNYGMMISGFAPIFNAGGEVIGVVGADISLATVMTSIRSFVTQILLAALGVALLTGGAAVLYINKHIGRPIKQLAGASGKMSDGDVDIHFQAVSTDELGQLMNVFNEMGANAQKQVQILTRIADCDYTESIVMRGEADELNAAIGRIVENNIQLISGIRNSAMQVASGASQVLAASQSQATGAIEQSATLDRLSSALTDVYAQAEKNATAMRQALTDVGMAEALISASNEQVQQMSQAMSFIRESSKEIAQVIKVIDEIAFQTNILALNAAVAAARAGQHGKGFAVVADEVRNLAQKSARAAKETEAMIESSIKGVKLGSEIMLQTEESLEKILKIASGNARSMQAVNEVSQMQTSAIQEINYGVEQIATVVQANSAAAVEGAASAEEMSTQATLLERMVAKFILPSAQSFGERARSPQTPTENESGAGGEKTK